MCKKKNIRKNKKEIYNKNNKIINKIKNKNKINNKIKNKNKINNKIKNKNKINNKMAKIYN